MMAALGDFVFAMSDLAYQTLSRKTAWRWAEGKRVGRRDALQFVGPDSDDITLAGLLAPGVTGRARAIAELRVIGDAGGAHVLVDGAGEVHGAFVIKGVSEDQALHWYDGVPRRSDFTLELKRVDDEDARALLDGASPAAGRADPFDGAPDLLWI